MLDPALLTKPAVDAWPTYNGDYSGRRFSTLNKINGLIEDIQRNPFRGLGKPEALKFALSGWWLRRIAQEHRLVYRVSGKPGQQVLEIAQCRYHY